MIRGPHHHPRMAIAAIATLAASAAAFAASSNAAGPMDVITLHGRTSQHVRAMFSYGVQSNSINGFSVSYTCHGKKAETDSDLYTLFDGGNDKKALALVKPSGAVTLKRTGHLSRFSEDGAISKGKGRLVLKAKLTRSGRKRVLKGTLHVNNAKCPSARKLTFRSVGTVPAPTTMG